MTKIVVGVGTTGHRGHARDPDADLGPVVRGDSRAAAEARVRLKLAAISFASSPPWGVDLVSASVISLCGAALAYYAAVQGIDYVPAGAEDPTIDLGDRIDASMSPLVVRVVGTRIRLKLAAIAYANARHGVDAHLEFTRESLGSLCAAAVAYAEALAEARSQLQQRQPKQQRT